RLPLSVRRAIDAARPDVVHTLLGNVRIMELALKVARYAGVPIVPHFMDDWPSTLYSQGEMWGVARARTARALRRVLSKSPVILVIGEAMAREFSTRYHRPTRIAGFGVDPHEWEHPRI